MKNYKLSLIIPVYNAECIIEDTLKCILNQTMIDDIEVIMVDDGSDDSSRYIIEKYALDYDNFYAYHKKHEGRAFIFDFAIKHAHADYIRFINPKDYISKDSCEILYNDIIEYDCDFVVGSVLMFDSNTIWQDYSSNRFLFKIYNATLVENIEDYPTFFWDNMLYNKIFKREFAQKNSIFVLNKKLSNPDVLFSLKSYLLADSFFISKKRVYFKRDEKTQNMILDNLETLHISKDIINKSNISDELKNSVYFKWLNHDLSDILKKTYPKKYHHIIMEFIKDIPDEVFGKLNSYKKILYSMIKNNDFDAINYFLPLEEELKKFPNIKLNISHEYKQLIDFSEDALNEKLKADKISIKKWDDTLIIDFQDSINYIDMNYPHNSSAELITKTDTYPLRVTENNQIMLPKHLIKNKNDLKIKLIYECDLFKKETLIKNNERQTFRYDDFDIDIGVGENWILTIDCYQKDDEIEIFDVLKSQDTFILKGKSNGLCRKIVMQNISSHKKHNYILKYRDDDTFEFSIPYFDIIDSPVPLWELKNKELSNSVKLSGEFKFYGQFDKITFKEEHGKILVGKKSYDGIKLIRNLKKDLKKCTERYNNLKLENKKLIKTNESLKKDIEEFKLRKVVKFTDKLKK